MVSGTEYVDRDVSNDVAYYYHVIAVDDKGHRSRPSNQDNAKALSKPRIYDAEIIAQNVPEKMRRGEAHRAEVIIRNTGSKAWDLDRPNEVQFWLETTQQWGSHDEDRLPKIALGSGGQIKPGEEVRLSFPYVGPKVGRFENHWVLSMRMPGRPPVYFGTPLLVETSVTQQEAD